MGNVLTALPREWQVGWYDSGIKATTTKYIDITYVRKDYSLTLPKKRYKRASH